MTSRLKIKSRIYHIPFLFLSLVLLIYLIWPGPNSIDDFTDLPGALKSTEPGDTWQVPNVAGYYSNIYRQEATTFYRLELQRLNNLPFRPLRLNYPPETAFTYIKDQTYSTYLEEFVYPMRGSLFVNGWEPLENGKPRYSGAQVFSVAGNLYETKVTLRFYPSPLWARIIVWLGVNITFIALLWLWKKGVIQDG